MPPRRAPAPLGLASSVSRRTAREVEGDLPLGTTRQRPSGRARPFKWRRLPPLPPLPREGVFPGSRLRRGPCARAAEPLGRPSGALLLNLALCAS